MPRGELGGDLTAHRVPDHDDGARVDVLQVGRDEVGMPFHGERAGGLGRLAESGQIEGDDPSLETLHDIEIDAPPHADAVQEQIRVRALTERLGDEGRTCMLELQERDGGALGGEIGGWHPSTLAEHPGALLKMPREPSFSRPG